MVFLSHNLDFLLFSVYIFACMFVKNVPDLLFCFACNPCFNVQFSTSSEPVVVCCLKSCLLVN